MTIRRRLKQWGISRTDLGSAELEDKIKELYFKRDLRDSKIIRALEKDGIKISKSTLAALRRWIGLQRRVVNPEDIQHTDNIVRDAVRKQLASGRIEGYREAISTDFFELRVIIFHATGYSILFGNLIRMYPASKK
ncbi:hypothetical protein TSTA_008420 [Talaromyces stipitatus ATCC 10500]|uniref:Clr5 domain-containing protein n=1 Tax=Talaromyces stipitatus (strain ATCC 10500 / CBS 375.48 / QM 6759 / NRRL 1006) TaxID=441959 RepID=B8MV90_TALSN|nr:uncharacterized protein TSTA_008420 [Talaromyces stipitatus ATCC 10500]EED11546.1 hypothetical protein TSTA_008420 [Talaromyces stipitatus ATCC 10500]